MNAFLPRIAVLAALIAGTAIAPLPAVAQKRAAEILVYGTDPCPRSTDDQIVVCSRRPEGERFRIPPNLRQSGPPQATNSWVNRAKAFDNSRRIGPMACDAVGPAGQSGCMLQEINQAARENRANVASDVPPPK